MSRQLCITLRRAISASTIYPIHVWTVNTKSFECLLLSCPRAARPSIKGQPATPAEPFGDEALEFIKDQIMQREVEIEVESCDKAGLQ